MKTPEECLIEQCKKVRMPFPDTSIARLCHETVISYHAQFEGECEWEVIGLSACPECLGLSFPDDMEKSVYVSGTYNYCPFCGSKIKRV